MITEPAALPFSRSPFRPRENVRNAEYSLTKNNTLFIRHYFPLLRSSSSSPLSLFSVISSLLSPTYDDTVSRSFPRSFHFRDATVSALPSRFSSLGNSKPPRTAFSIPSRKISFLQRHWTTRWKAGCAATPSRCRITRAGVSAGTISCFLFLESYLVSTRIPSALDSTKCSPRVYALHSFFLASIPQTMQSSVSFEQSKVTDVDVSQIRRLF